MGRPPPLHPDTFTAMNTVALHILLECDLCPQRCASSVGEPSRPSPAASPPAGPGLESRPRPRAQARSPLQPSSLSSQPSSSARGLCGAPWPTAGTGCPRTQCCRAADRSRSPTSSSPSSLLRASRFPAAPEASCSLHPAFKAPRTRADATSCPSASVLPSSCDDGPPHPVCQGHGHLDSRVCFAGSCGHATESGQWNEPSPAQCSLRPSLGDNASEVRSLMPPSWAVI